MRLYVVNNRNQKVYIDVIAPTRAILANRIGNEFFNINGEVYSVWDVYAEVNSNSTAAGTVIGGLIGLIGGPIGLLTGGTIGALVGNTQDSTDKEKVNQFNRS